MNKEVYNKTQKELNENQIAVDFDGVIHKSSRGYHDGTVYDEPVEGSLESLLALKQMGYGIVVYTCKAHPQRPLVEGKTGIELVWEWLGKYEVSGLVDEVVWGKPWAKLYIDDKGYRFENWKDTIKFIHDLKEK